MGLHYARERNSDLGPDDHSNVSGLSPFVRRRLILEEELAQRAISGHSDGQADKFVQEVLWRTYWKGWLEQHPSVWSDYSQTVVRDRETLSQNKSLEALYDNAIQGETGMDCFDFWARELVDTGYLHNHARMWFASIWVFTFDLPWTLGAAFFLKHLLDGDPASNTLSWRWVSGRHTVGKTYLASASNIERFTNGRFSPGPNALADSARPPNSEERPEQKPLTGLPPVDWSKPSLVLITEDDCCPADLIPQTAHIVGLATLPVSRYRTSSGASENVVRFEKEALDDAAQRTKASLPADAIQLAEASQLADCASTCGAEQIITPYLPVGYGRDHILASLENAERTIPLHQVRRGWDDVFWPHANAGFFKLKKKSGPLLKQFSM
ncbi:MAG: FAD-binding domain-containing protein [Pseudomonadota bacterium]